MDVNEFLPLIPDGLYDPSEVILIGSHLTPAPEEKPDLSADSSPDAMSKMKTYLEALMVGEMQLHSDLLQKLRLVALRDETQFASGEKPEANCPTVALIYAYGYEGHSYRLTKPRIMIVKGEGKPYQEVGSSGAAGDMIGKLYVWHMSKHQQTVSVEVETGDLKSLVLDANQPGNRSVQSYSAHMQMAHRGGKLS
ncbi:hypothetical protein R3X27_07660 [Tropicimonas sp. TH_r6]|uniref:hypothetical protein n=1 Tax=Tropicimonas sp. TH_r6 TaxID=3082085 RepID=UPI002954F225|nr:hypothetical protein [Tropicimonas sp. TH_r6]MDV7142557.1 hypothetical protein [Tropicimonas sp. TH_r6]